MKMKSEQEIQQRVDFALMLTHLYGAIGELKCSAFTIPESLTGKDAVSELKNINNALGRLTEKMHARYKELYQETEEDE